MGVKQGESYHYITTVCQINGFVEKWKVSPGNKTIANRNPVWIRENDGRPTRAIFCFNAFPEEKTEKNIHW